MGDGYCMEVLLCSNLNGDGGREVNVKVSIILFHNSLYAYIEELNRFSTHLNFNPGKFTIMISMGSI